MNTELESLIDTYGDACTDLGYASADSTFSQGQISIAYKKMLEARSNLFAYLKNNDKGENE